LQLSQQPHKKKQLLKPNQLDWGHNDNVYQCVDTIDW
jgi:hypothetical protein